VKVEDGAVYLNSHELATLATDLARPVAGPARRTATA
jgi:nitrite reductase (NADH) small subunit